MATFLQKLSREVNWVTGCKLHRFSYRFLPTLAMSDKTCNLITEYNDIVEELKESIKKDYESQREYIRRNREQR